MPVDGASSDKFGGSVILPDPAKLAGFERGDFVVARGRVGGADPKKGPAPLYEVAEIKRLGPAAD